MRKSVVLVVVVVVVDDVGGLFSSRLLRLGGVSFEVEDGGCFKSMASQVYMLVGV